MDQSFAAIVRQEFPLLNQQRDLVYLDNAATTQTPESVLKAMDDYYRSYRANIARGLYDISTVATEHYETARRDIAQFIKASPEEIIFTSGTTQGLNMLASALCKKLSSQHSVILTRYEHHANLIPWQELSRQYGFSLRFIDLTADYELDMNSAERVIDNTTAIVSVASVSNALGITSPLSPIIALAQKNGAITIVDAAQSIAHSPTDVRKLDCDFLVFSGHKLYGPTGIGILYGKKDRLKELEPINYGGGMVQEVTYEQASWQTAPQRFEAGTPNIAGAIGLGAAVRFLTHVDWEQITTHEHTLVRYFFEHMPDFAHCIGPQCKPGRSSIISFTLEGIHPHDIAEVLNTYRIAVRAGSHCAQPLMQKLGIPGTVRISCGIYTTLADIDCLFAGLYNVQKVFKR